MFLGELCLSAPAQQRFRKFNVMFFCFFSDISFQHMSHTLYHFLSMNGCHGPQIARISVKNFTMTSRKPFAHWLIHQIVSLVNVYEQPTLYFIHHIYLRTSLGLEIRVLSLQKQENYFKNQKNKSGQGQLNYLQSLVTLVRPSRHSSLQWY